MNLIKRNNEIGTIDVFINEGNKILAILFGGNGDLYWTIHDMDAKADCNCIDFDITKENYGVYSLFKQLYDDIENVNIFSGDFPQYIITNFVDYKKYLKDKKTQKKRYHKFNYSNYCELFD